MKIHNFQLLADRTFDELEDSGLEETMRFYVLRFLKELGALSAVLEEGDRNVLSERKILKIARSLARIVLEFSHLCTALGVRLESIFYLARDILIDENPSLLEKDDPDKVLPKSTVTYYKPKMSDSVLLKRLIYGYHIRERDLSDEGKIRPTKNLQGFARKTLTQYVAESRVRLRPSKKLLESIPLDENFAWPEKEDA